MLHVEWTVAQSLLHHQAFPNFRVYIEKQGEAWVGG